MISLPSQPSHSATLHDLAPDLTPMLDILFILLVFLMLSTGAVFQAFELELPSAAQERTPIFDSKQEITLEIRRHGYGLNGQSIADFDQLKAALSQTMGADPDQGIIVAGDRDTPLEQLLRVLTYLESEGATKVDILMHHDTKIAPAARP